ncbi:MAG: YtxH domain-containing protein [Pyrinomonadaceae bacterium]
MSEQNKYENGVANYSRPAIGVRDGLMYFIAGTGIGAAIALLFAPKAGYELRGNIADVTRKGYDATLEKAADLKSQSADVIQTVKDKAGSVYDFASAKLASTSDTVSDAVSATSGVVVDGLERLQNETGISAKNPANGRKSSSIV